MRTRSQNQPKRDRGQNEEKGKGISTSNSKKVVRRCANQDEPCKQKQRRREEKILSSDESKEKEMAEILQRGDSIAKPNLPSSSKENISLVFPDTEKVVYDDLPLSGEDETDQIWEDASVTTSVSDPDNPSRAKDGLIVEFTELASSSQRKSSRRFSIAEKELAELVHKVHLLCLLGRGRVVDRACNDPLIQASLLSLLPPEMLKIGDTPKLTTNVLAPLVKWFHGNFKVQSSSTKEGTFDKNLAFALGTHEGTAEEVAALSVALLRALNLPVRFISVLDAISLKPDADGSASSSQNELRLDTKASSSINIATRPNNVFILYPHYSNEPSDQDAQQSRSQSSWKEKSTTGSPSVGHLSGDIAISSTSKVCGEMVGTSAAVCSERKRKGDLEFELQLEMALSSTAAGIHDDHSVFDTKESNSLLDKTPSKKMKMKMEKSPLSPGNLGAVWSRKSGPPLYWSEVFCSGENLTGRWVHIDAANGIIDGEQKVEAAAAACRRPLRYVIAFAGNGAKDVTRRYCTQWYKIAPQRVCSEWWDTVLAPLKEMEASESGGMINFGTCTKNVFGDPRNAQEKSYSLDVDCKDLTDSVKSVEISEHTSLTGNPEVQKSKQLSMKVKMETSCFNQSFASRSSLEDMELETRALTEPLPTNQQAYRNHHLYALERWLTTYQVLHPRGPVLGYCSGHPVFPRSCVQTLQTRHKWLREGLQVKENEVPTKVIRRRSKFGEVQTSELDISEEDVSTCTELYGKWQTEPLCLPCAVNGIVPKNERGQIDVWSEKCLPPGTVHLRLPRLVPVAKRLGVNFAPAMVGFEFSNGRSFPVFEGIVVCTEFQDAILEAYAEEEERREAVERKHNEAQALSRWYQLISSMVTRQRLSNLYEISPSSHGPSTSSGQARIDDLPKDATTRKCELPCEPQQASSVHYAGSDNASAGNHEHTFPLEDQTFDEETSVRTKRCPCGFCIQVEEL